MGNALIFIAEVIRIPRKKTEKAAGFDLKSSVAFDVQPFDQITVGTGVRVSLPTGHYGQIVDKSSFSTRNSLFIAAGVIDEDYTGEIKVVLFNPTPKLRSIAKDTVFAQLIVLPYYHGGAFSIEPTQAQGWHRQSARGPSGFGLHDTAGDNNIKQKKKRINFISLLKGIPTKDLFQQSRFAIVFFHALQRYEWAWKTRRDPSSSSAPREITSTHVRLQLWYCFAPSNHQLIR